MKCYMIKDYLVDMTTTLCDKSYWTYLQSHAIFSEPQEGYTPVKICAYIRTTRSNKILITKYGRISYKMGIMEDDEYFLFEEMGIKFAKTFLPHLFEAKDLIGGLHIFPVGAFTFDESPYLCYNIIVPDDITPIKEGYRFEPIWGQSVAEPILNAMSKSFVMVKGEEK